MLTAAEAASLSGVDVVGSDGAAVGRVRDVYLMDRDRSIAALGVTRGRLSTTTVLVPAAVVLEETLRPHSGEYEHTAPIRLSVPARSARAAEEPPATGHLSPEDLRRAELALLPTGSEEAPQG
ncbi:PRC-barrel domain-containing protein [Brachybacterium sp. SGAir0954]|uniref:PRC-barrel domain-containing protein n=1 Tax=Brachybacterium sp. SGAir0954 TaxID=2571029 RepID=UPI001F0E68B1|nr:PRC-barrel domain-containing protein [Brachybacterium sp. SGAir0954]